MGLNPREVIGHSIHDLVQSNEDSQTIRENLKPKGMYIQKTGGKID